MPQFNDTPDPKRNGNGKKERIIASGFGVPKDPESVAKQYEKAIDKATSKKQLPPKITEPRCHVCVSPYRDYIERCLFVHGHSYQAIANSIPDGSVERRSISAHHKKHMAINEAAYRAILESEAEIEGQNYEDGVRGAITGRGILEIMSRKGLEDVLNDTTIVEPKDLIQIIKLKAELDAQHAIVQVEEAKRQVAIFTQAIQTIIPPDLQAALVREIKRLRKREEDLVPYERVLEPPPIEGTVTQ